MKKLLIKYGLLDYITLDFKISNEDFDKILVHLIDVQNYNYNIFEGYKVEHKLKYKGRITNNKIILQRKRTFKTKNLAIAKGVYIKNKGSIKLKLIIKTFDRTILEELSFYLLMPLVFLVLVASYFIMSNEVDILSDYNIFFTLVMMTFMILAPINFYFTLKEDVINLKNEIKMDFLKYKL